MEHFFSKSERILFIGIGGIGISAIAKLALSQGATVFGVDLASSSITRDLETSGAIIKIGRQATFDLKKQGISLIVQTTAAPATHPLIKNGKKLNIPILTYPQILGEISKKFITIAVSGMHGKSTTTAMIGILSVEAGLDPLVIVGTKVREWGGNIRLPLNSRFNKNQPLFIVEADEYKSAMLNLLPTVIVLTRIEEDHLDYYRDLQHIKQEFKKYLKNLAPCGALIANWQDKNIRALAKNFPNKIIKYNNNDDDDALAAKIKSILKVPGRHNLENALAAYKVGEYLGLSEKQILSGLAKFNGTWRRLELAGKIKKNNAEINIISDYAHHPSEIKASLQAIREQYPDKRILLAYQPHQHNRTKKLFKDFVTVFDQADVVIMNEIFDVAGREENPDQNISSRDLVRAIQKRIKKRLEIKNLKLRSCCYAKNLSTTKLKILKSTKPNDIIVIMGAGDIDTVARQLVAKKYGKVKYHQQS